MIHVDPKPEPPVFEARVGRPGALFLGKNCHPTSRQWENHSYWRRVLPQLHAAYDGICTYSSEFIPYLTGVDTVEHFLPKTEHPTQAYSWANYRLVCLRMNGRKGTRHILDPFRIENTWFVLQFPSLQVLLGPSIPVDLLSAANETISVLDLNGEASIRSRERWVRDYCRSDITEAYLQRNAPFIHMELQRQGLITRIVEVMHYPGTR
jgi:hypothetical protein